MNAYRLKTIIDTEIDRYAESLERELSVCNNTDSNDIQEEEVTVIIENIDTLDND